ncbi:MAG: tyrosine-type recombinase/integrase [gamma proteobacterium endosymbiont of Lamellibrachia anaximandri]|nr:tyrosine-type recombinase/integrase [gamma proteobacterium endosymbiont of Lamellibrachia anaximandri]
MALEQVFKCPKTLGKLRSGPLGGLLDRFCNALLQAGFTESTIRKHLANVSHLNAYLGAQRHGEEEPLSASIIAEFFSDYPAQARHQRPLEQHLAGVKASINRFVDYLRLSGRFETLVETEINPPLLAMYLDWLREHRHVASGTIEIRARSIGRFLQWLGPQAAQQVCSELTAEMVESFFLAYAKEKGYAARRSMQAALRTFFRFCLQQGYIRQSLDRAVPTLRRYKLATVPRGLSEDPALKLLQSIDRSSPAGQRDYAICQLLHTYGVRSGQVRILRLEDIDWADDRVLFRALKHGKETLLPLTQEVGSSLIDYLQNARPRCRDPHLFLTSRAPYRALGSSNVVSNIVARHIHAVGIEITCKGAHIFRHGFATRMLDQGHSLKEIADVLGHRHLGTTFIYTKVDFKQLKQVALPWPGEAVP